MLYPVALFGYHNAGQVLGRMLPVNHNHNPDVLLPVEVNAVGRPASLAQLHGYVYRVSSFRNGEAGTDPTLGGFDKNATTALHRKIHRQTA